MELEHVSPIISFRAAAVTTPTHEEVKKKGDGGESLKKKIDEQTNYLKDERIWENNLTGEEE